MRVTLHGTRGSLPTAGRSTVRYGGNTSCVAVRVCGDTLIVLDAGTGIRELGRDEPGLRRVDVLLTHLHMDHLLGLGFFRPLFTPGLEVHVWGPSSVKLGLRQRLARYLSPPLFPVRLRDLPCRLSLHDAPRGTFDLPGARVTADLVTHPGPTFGYRLSTTGGILTYLPDHEPALGTARFPSEPRWTSGHDLAAGADVLIHDAQYFDHEYPRHVGWGHSSVSHVLAFAGLAGVGRLVPFHHDPDHDDDDLDRCWGSIGTRRLPFPVTPAREGESFEIGAG